jgi:hypothetical protein
MAQFLQQPAAAAAAACSISRQFICRRRRRRIGMVAAQLHAWRAPLKSQSNT